MHRASGSPVPVRILPRAHPHDGQQVIIWRSRQGTDAVDHGGS